MPKERGCQLNDPEKKPFDLWLDQMLDQIRAVVQEEIASALANGGAADHPMEKENWLTPAEAASIIGVNKARVYRYARKWSFAKKISPKALRISESGLRRWIATRK